MNQTFTKMATKSSLPITILILSCQLLYTGTSSSLDNINMKNFKFRWNKEDEVAKTQSHQASQIGCDMSIGEWVYDRSYPLYDSSCPYLSTEFNCGSNGRPDSNYDRWRWRPKNCLLPRYIYMTIYIASSQCQLFLLCKYLTDGF